jgi:hypothetical protein
MHLNTQDLWTEGQMDKQINIILLLYYYYNTIEQTDRQTVELEGRQMDRLTDGQTKEKHN